jgi:coenzyme F420-reducing hydrogenase delta subunit
MDEDVVIKRGIDALVKVLGTVEAVRFISLPCTGRLDTAIILERHANLS